MKYLLSFILLFYSIAITAQDKKSKKLYKQFEKGNYEKCEKLAQKTLQKERSNPDANYLIGLIKLKEGQSSTSKSAKKRALKDALQKGDNIDQKELSQYKMLRDSIQTYIYLYLLDPKLSKSYKKYYVGVLASEFGDTLDVYMTLFKANEYNTKKSYVSNNAYPQDSLRRIMLQLALKLEGTPYKWAGENPSGFDCSGFTSYVYKSIGVTLPHSAQKQSELIKKRKNLSEAIPGDLIFFGSQDGQRVYTKHAGIIYSIDGNDIEVVHCVSNGVNIEGKDSSWDRYWINEVLFVVDVLSNSDEILNSD